MRISINGKQVESIILHGTEPELNYGYGVFETIRTYAGVPFQLEAHLKRLHDSAEAIDLIIPVGDKKIQEWIKPHCPSDATTPDRRIKIIATPERIYILSRPLDTHSTGHTPGHTQGITLQLIAHERHLPHAKLLTYASEYIAHRTAQAAGYYDALFMAGTQEIREAAFANFFIVKNNVLITPRHNILQGITRQIVMQLAEPYYEIKQRKVLLEEVMVADEAFITQTTTGILPVIRIDKHIVGTGRPGEITQRIMELFQAYVNNDQPQNNHVK